VSASPYPDTPEGRMSWELQQAERKAWDSLSRYKFQMFGYWAAIWVHLNRISGARLANPFAELVAEGRDHSEQMFPEPKYRWARGVAQLKSTKSSR
jgi:hypothetical protein